MLRKILPCIISLGILLLPTIGLGQVYPEVKIGTQVWMSKNLDVDTFRNGDKIPEAKTNEEWRAATENKQPAWCYYENDPANGAKYGKLYNWYAVNDSRGLAPIGWHIPSDSEWTALETSLGNDAGIKMKSEAGWKSIIIDVVCTNCNSWSDEYRVKHKCNICSNKKVMERQTVSGGGNNTSGFNALPGGGQINGSFNFIENESGWWSSSEQGKVDAWIRSLINKKNKLLRNDIDKHNYLSVRCIKD